MGQGCGQGTRRGEAGHPVGMKTRPASLVTRERQTQVRDGLARSSGNRLTKVSEDLGKERPWPPGMDAAPQPLQRAASQGLANP